jgi:hypothetical protein
MHSRRNGDEEELWSALVDSSRGAYSPSVSGEELEGARRHTVPDVFERRKV